MKIESFEALVHTVGNVAGDVPRIEALVHRTKALVYRTKALVRRTKENDEKALEQLCALLVRVAFATPEAIPVVYNALTREWLGLDTTSLPLPSHQQEAVAFLRTEERLPDGFWTAFWQFIEDARNPLPATVTTVRVSALALTLPASFHERAEILVRSHPGVTKADERVLSEPFVLETLQALPEGSLGHAFYRLIVDHKFDLEVVDRNIEELRHLPPGLRYVNVRMLQMHDVWHLAAGYTTAALHENALASFQLAQFGHTYSAMYLATVIYLTFLYHKDAREVLLQVVAEAWYHSAQCPSFMDIDWESEWHLPVAEIHRRQGIQPFDSIYKDILIEAAIAFGDTALARSVQRLDKILGLALNEKLSSVALKVHVWAVAREKRRARRKP